VFLKWPSSGIVDLDGTKGREVFAWLTYAMLAAAILIVPVFPSTSLVTEVRRRTLELLLNSPLSRTSIYLGKMLAMLGFVLLLLFATLPALTCCYLMGGLSFTDDVSEALLVSDTRVAAIDCHWASGRNLLPQHRIGVAMELWRHVCDDHCAVVSGCPVPGRHQSDCQRLSVAQADFADSGADENAESKFRRWFRFDGIA
jgi:hypothetical protein